MWADALPNLLIGLREGLEAGLVVSILLAAVRRSAAGEQPRSTAPIWLGVLAAVLLAFSFGAVLTFYRSIMSTTGQEALGGVLSVVAVALVTGMVFWMRRAARGLSTELRAKVADALRVSTAALALTAFLAVGREGLETALFLWTAAQAAGTTLAPLAGAGVGIASATVLCVLLYRRAVKIRLDRFFHRTAVLLIIIAAGVLAYGIADLQDAGLLPGHTWVAFDLSKHLDAGSWWVTLIGGVTNLSTTMTWLQVLAYVGYLAAVFASFARAGRAAHPDRSGSPAPNEAAGAIPAKNAPAAGAVPNRPTRRRTVFAATVAALVVPPVAAAALILLAPGGASGAGQQIEVTATSCAPGWSTARGGGQTFTVANKSGHTAEVTLVQTADQGIVAEIETLGPGTQLTLPATLTSGAYAWRCLISGLPTTVSATVRVNADTGAAPTTPLAVKPVSVADLQPALKQYDTYVEGRLAELATRVAAIRVDLAGGRLGDARRDWLLTQPVWEQVGAAYGSFGELGDAIGGKPQGLPRGVNDPSFTGLHRLEYGLWHGQSAATLIPVVDKLSVNIRQLEATLPQVTIDPTDLPTRAHEILEDALRDHLSGATEQGAGAEYPETLADVQATRVVLGELAALLNARDPGLLATAYDELDSVRQALLETRANGVWRGLSQTPVARREQVNAAVDAALETLARVPDLLEVPAH